MKDRILVEAPEEHLNALRKLAMKNKRTVQDEVKEAIKKHVEEK